MKPAFTLSAFGDEISPELSEQLRVLNDEGIRHLELRTVLGKNALELSGTEAGEVRAAVHRRGVRVSAIGSPIGKIRVSEPFLPHLDRFRRALDLAAFFDCGYIRLFSFYPAEGQEGTIPPRERVLERMRAFERASEGYDVKLAIENELNLYGDTPERCGDLLAALSSDRWVAVFDPGNYAYQGIAPFDRALPLLKDYIGYCHIKDMIEGSADSVPPGQGDGQIAEVLTALKESGVSCFLSLEPHLSRGGQFGGFTGARLFRVAAGALKKILTDIGADWA